ncbi:MAG: pseudomurein-binding protein [Methanobacterium sp.]|nr:pseudomurein-binding protein [Methanobacterium sp.]
MESLTLIQYRKMVEEVIDFKKHHGEMPKYTIVAGFRIDRDDYIDMIERVNKFFLEMGRNPERVEIGNTETNMPLWERF